MEKTVVICEFNPFHNGHKHLFDEIKKARPGTLTICVMSGDFTQRGRPAVMPAMTRAKGAVECGADAVVALPTVFSVAPAEIFAKGAVKMASAMKDVTCLAFGCECQDVDVLVRAARETLSADFSSRLKEQLLRGIGYAAAYEKAYTDMGGQEGIFSKPNNILAAEYIRAADEINFNPDFFAVPRAGANHGSTSPKGAIASSSFIRANMAEPAKIAPFAPPNIISDIEARGADISDAFFSAARVSVLRDGAEELKKAYGCTEGLEKLIYDACARGENPEEKANKRYSRSRISRILCANLLKITRADTEMCLGSELYIRPLSVKREKKDEMLSDLSESAFPLCLRGRDFSALRGAAKFSAEKDETARLMYRALGGKEDEKPLFL
ncbi:MAG: nucleotidyltransferase family protein [Clostridia bacterium]|nr:nucleotidyltransferase family protein [Clostridia bacterium]